MTNEEKAREIHSKLGIYADAYYGAMEMAQWKDEQHAQEKQQWIDKAWDWLTNQKGERTKEDFIKAMKGGKRQ